MRLPIIALLTCVTLLTGCPGPTGGATGGGTGGSGGGSGGSGGAGGSNSIPLDQICTQLFNAYCSIFARCGALANPSMCPLVPEADCALEQRVAVDAGRILYNGQQAAACLNTINSVACTSDFVLGGPACEMVFVGLVANGSRCGSDQECVPGSHCKVTAGTCGGICAQRIAVGQPVGMLLMRVQGHQIDNIDDPNPERRQMLA